jgi:hypothetical protein
MTPDTADTLTAFAMLAALVVLVKIVTDHVTMRRIMGAHLSDAALRELLQWTRDVRRGNALKWGMVGVAVGIAMILVDVLSLDADDPSAFGIVIIAGSVALLAFHAVERRGGSES